MGAPLPCLFSIPVAPINVCGMVVVPNEKIKNGRRSANLFKHGILLWSPNDLLMVTPPKVFLSHPVSFFLGGVYRCTLPQESNSSQLQVSAGQTDPSLNWVFFMVIHL